MAEAYLQEIGNDVLVEMFAEAWRTDNSETDGNRSYAVSGLRLSLEKLGYPSELIGACSTQACVIVHSEKTGEGLQ